MNCGRKYNKNNRVKCNGYTSNNPWRKRSEMK